jgi:hypothetical protein
VEKAGHKSETGWPRRGAHTLVVGGPTRNIGKTALVVDLLRALPEYRWTAIKITQYGHDICAVHGESCDCAPAEHSFALSWETDCGGRSDTSRFLAAGGERALWLRVRAGELAQALPALRAELAETGNVIIESNSILQFLRPDVYLVVLHPAVEDFKESSRRMLDRADAFVLRAPLGRQLAAQPPVALSLIQCKPCFLQELGAALPAALVEWVRARLRAKHAPGKSEAHFSC